MIFRPLCIDYRSRAQEILLNERDDAARRASRCFLPHRTSDSSAKIESTAESERCSSGTLLNTADDGTIVNTLSLNQINQLLGPAVHPSECALRQISPVTNGPIRGVKLPISENKPLPRLVDAYAKGAREEMKNVVLALESGRSRFEEPLLIDDDTDEVDYQLNDVFHETMMVLYCKQMGIEEIKLPKRVNLAKRSSTSTAVPSFIRHGPPDLDRIYQLKNLRMRGDATSFADTLSTMFVPELKSLLGEVDFQDDLPHTCKDVYTGPKFDPAAYCKPDPPGVDYAARKVGSFTNFFDELLSNQDSSNSIYQDYKPPSNVLETLDDISQNFIRIDPDLPSNDNCARPTKQELQSVLFKLLNDLCSAPSISTKLKLSTRFEAGHEVIGDAARFEVTTQGPRFKFLEDVTVQDEALLDTSFDSCLNFIETRDEASAENFVPRKISLESSLKLFDEAEETELTKRPSTNEMLSSLPSYSSQISFTPKLREKGKSRQRRHVKSSVRVSEAHALKNVVDSSAAPCLFLPQVKIPSKAKAATNSTRRRTSSDDDEITRLIRSCASSGNTSRDLQLLLQCNSDYPIENWLNSNGTGSIPSHQSNESEHASELQKELIMNKRVAFCEKAALVGRQETQRNLLLTGCSARRNAVSMFAYRGILTNQLVDPEIYQVRYTLVLDAKKAARLNKSSSTQPNFVEMAQSIMVASLLRCGKKKKRGAQLAARLRTRRHGSLDIDQQTPEPTQLDTRYASPNLTRVNHMAASANMMLSGLSNAVVEELGETLKKERGELLHLVSKADELEKEEKAYLDELAVLNRRGDTSKDDMFDFAVDSEKKRKELINGELDEMKQMKKKRKKDKRKGETPEERAARKAAKKQRKEDRKRKRQNDNLPENPSEDPKKTTHDMATQKRDSSAQPKANESSFLASARRNIKVAVPSVQLGVTPIVPPKKKESQEIATVQTKRSDQSKKTLDSIALSRKIKDSTLLSTAKKNSPDSVASLHEGRKLLFSHKKYNAKMIDKMYGDAIEDIDISLENAPKPSDLFSSAANEVTSNNNETSEMQDPVEFEPQDDCVEKYNNDFHVEKASIRCYNNGEQVSLEDTFKHDSLTMLTSESFLEDYSEVVAELASGRWTNALAPHEKNKVQLLANPNVSICDCPLVDVVGVDIELSKEKGLIVQRLSNWLDCDQGIQMASRTFIKKLVQLAASGRYKYLHVVLCVDIDVTSNVSNEFVTLQNALALQSGCHCDQVTFEFVRPRVLPATLALHLISNRSLTTDITDFISDENTSERARFLLMLVPSMTVHMALACLGHSEDQNHSEQSGEALYKLLHSAKTTSRKNFVDNTSSILSNMSANQLWLSLHVDISHAH